MRVNIRFLRRHAITGETFDGEYMDKVFAALRKASLLSDVMADRALEFKNWQTEDRRYIEFKNVELEDYRKMHQIFGRFNIELQKF